MIKTTAFFILFAAIGLAPATAENLRPVSSPQPTLPARASGLSSAAPALQAGALPGQQFTFRVPVSLSAIHSEVRLVAVKCYVSESTVGPALSTGILGGPGGRWETTVPLDASGSYSGTVVVGGSLPAGVDPARAKSYWCGLVLYHGAVEHVGCPADAAGCDTWRGARTGTTFSPVAMGPLP